MKWASSIDFKRQIRIFFTKKLRSRLSQNDKIGTYIPVLLTPSNNKSTNNFVQGRVIEIWPFQISSQVPYQRHQNRNLLTKSVFLEDPKSRDKCLEFFDYTLPFNFTWGKDSQCPLTRHCQYNDEIFLRRKQINWK